MPSHRRHSVFLGGGQFYPKTSGCGRPEACVATAQTISQLWALIMCPFWKGPTPDAKREKCSYRGVFSPQPITTSCQALDPYAKESANFLSASIMARFCDKDHRIDPAQ